MNLDLRWLMLAVVLPLAAQQPDAARRAEAQKDPTLAAMLTELDRSKAELALKDFARPFYIEYRVEDVENFQTEAEYGATEGTSLTHQRIARVVVRVGDWKTDSSGSRAEGVLQLVPLGDDALALRTALWAATDQAYKTALASYAQKQAALKQVETPPQADDFSHETPLIVLEPVQHLSIDGAAWEARMARVSGLYRSADGLGDLAAKIEISTANMRARTRTTWLATTEGTIVRKSSSEYMEHASVQTQADDGMRLERATSSAATQLNELDDEAHFTAHALARLGELDALRHAPLVEEEYHGPLLFAGESGAQILEHLMGDAVVAMRPRMGTEARTTGPFASSYHARVLPATFDVVDDPSLAVWNGRHLFGSYAVDDEGIAAHAVELVHGGRLESYLIGRQPVRDLPQSNGHARATVVNAPRPTIGVLKIVARDGISKSDLNARLLAMAHDRELSHVYVVDVMAGGLSPRMLYKLSADGKRELVRGAVLDEVDTRALRSSVEAAGSDLALLNHYSDVPTTVLAPPLLLGDATVRRANEKNDKLPFYPAPKIQ